MESVLFTQDAQDRGETQPVATSKPPREIELKLAATADAIERIRQAPILAQNALNQGVSRRLDATYFDTESRLLDRHGFSLRLRSSGKRHLQTLKRAGASPLERDEWEMAVPERRLDLSLFPLAEIGAPLADLQPDALQPVFACKVRRRLRKITWNDALIEIAFDEGALEAGDKTQPICEIELELKSGEPAALYQLALALLDIAPLQLETRSKASRGYDLVFGASPQIVKAEPTAIVAADNVDAAITKILWNGHRHLTANLAAVAAQDHADGVHQMRVALRRLRTALSLVARELAPPAILPLAVEARTLAQVLGPARNWDVFATDTLDGIGAAELPHVDLAVLRTAAKPSQAESYAGVRAALASPRTSRFLLGFGRLVESGGWRNGLASDAMTALAEPVPGFAERALTASHLRVLKRGRRFKRLDSVRRHELRLALKKFRYTADFFLPLYQGEGSAGKYLKRLSALQEALGQANDAATTEPLLGALRAGASDPAIHFASGAVLGWQRRDQVAASRKLLRNWRGFKAAQPFWA